MTSFLGRPSVSGVRWIARILGTLIGLLLLAEFIEGVTATNPPATIRDYLVAAGGVLTIVGFAVGWFKELAAALLILAGTALIAVIILLLPGMEWPWQIFIITGLLGLLFLYVHVAGRKK
jgi:hypothetical protein